MRRFNGWIRAAYGEACSLALLLAAVAPAAAQEAVGAPTEAVRAFHAALAAGETPSPELVADAGAAGGLRPAIAWSCLAAALALMALVLTLTQQTSLIYRAPLTKPTGYLVER